MGIPIANQVQIWNGALRNVGVTKRVSGVDELTVEAELCRDNHTPVLREVLEALSWPWARRQQALSELSGVTRNGWDYVYGLPEDCVTPLVLLETDVRSPTLTPQSRVEFSIMMGDDLASRVLCTDLAPADLAYLEYIAYVDNTAMWSGYFLTAYKWRMSMELALPLTKDMKRYQFCEQQYAIALESAAAYELNQPHVDEPETPSISARF